VTLVPIGDNDDVIDSAVVRIGPDLSGFTTKLKKDLEKAVKGVEAKVKVVADGVGLRASVKEAVTKQQALRGQPTYKVKVVADGSGLRESVRLVVKEQMALGKQPVYKVKVVADTKGLKGSAERAAGSAGGGGGGKGGGDPRLGPVVGQPSRDDLKRVRNLIEEFEKQRDGAAKAEAAREAQRVRSDTENLQRIRGQAQDAELARERQKYRNHQEQMDALHRQALEHELGEERKASTAREKVREVEAKRRNKELFTSPQLIDYGGKGIKPMNLLYGVVTAMTPALFAMGSSALQASTSIAALGSAGIGAALGLGGVLVAFQGLGDVLSLRQQVLKEETTAAANGAKGAVQAADDLAQAKRTLANAQRDETEAAADVHKARREAIRDLADLKQAVIDLDNQYKSDVISVEEKRQADIATSQNFFATALDRARAHQDYLDAKTKLSDTTLERKQKKEDLRSSLKKGIEGSDKVRDAKERARDATDRRKDAQNALGKASTGAAGGVDKMSSAAANLEAKIKQLSPAAQDMYHWFEKNETLFKNLQREISQKTLPGFSKFLTAITTAPSKGTPTTLQLAADYAGDLGAIISKYAGKLGEFTNSPLFRKSMGTIQETNARAIDKLGQATLTLADPITRILAAAAPGFESLSDTILDLSTRFSDWIKKLDENGGLAKWFKDSRTELGKWYDIAVNIGTIIRNLFTASLPAGGSLVESFRDFTKYLADLSGSKEGQKWLIDFFDKIRNLPYADIINFFKNAAIFFAAFRFVKYLKAANPFLLALSAFAASNPQAAAQALSMGATAIGAIMEHLATHPKEATLLLALLAAWKINKALNLGLKIPGIDQLKNALTSKFKVLDKFIGGGANTATMTVHAGVVNVYGKAIGGGGSVGDGGLDFGGDGKGKGKGKIKPKGSLGNRVSNAAGGLGTGNILIAAALAGAAIGTDELDRVKELLSGKAENAYHSWSDAIAKKPFDADNWYNTFVDNSLVVMLPLLAKKLLGGKVKNETIPDFSAKPIAGEKNAYERLTKDLSMTGGFDNATAQASLTAYIAKRKSAVSAYVRWVKSNEGPVAAAEAQRVEDEKSKTALEDLYLQYGYTEEAARKYAEKAYAVGQETKTATGWVKGFNDKLGTLSERLDAVTGKKQIVLTIDGDAEKKVFNSLESAAAYQQTIRQGIAPTQANLQKQKIIFQKNMADGGRVGGYSPHDKADNIPAMLTADEYVQPVAAVKHYGTDFMEAIRTRRFPKYADGGQVGLWKFPVKFPDALKPVQEFVGVPGTGPNGPAYTGKIPRGVGAIAGVNAQLAAAAIDVHRALGTHVSSGLRTGAAAITATGNKSYHGFGRAIDLIPPSMMLFNYLKAKYGKFAREIIYTPAGHNQVWRGRDHLYRDPRTQRDHWNHVHLALANGGLVRKYDTGGVLPPGFSQVYNGTGRNETVRTDRQEKALATGPTRIDSRDLILMAHYMAQAVGSPAITMDGRRVAETTNRYNYLPAGV
jgi:hypothetical protein